MKKMVFPELRQNHYYDCGAIAMQGVLMYYGIDINEQTVMKIAGTNRKIGTSPAGLKKVAKKFGLKYKDGEMNLPLIKKYIKKKIPVIILIQAWKGLLGIPAWKKNIKDWQKEWNDGHYVVPIGFDKERIYFEDPSCFVRTYLTFSEFEDRWRDLMIINGRKKKLVNYGIAFYGKKPVFNGNEAVHMNYDAFNEKNYTYKDYKRFR